MDTTVVASVLVVAVGDEVVPDVPETVEGGGGVDGRGWTWGCLFTTLGAGPSVPDRGDSGKLAEVGTPGQEYLESGSRSELTDGTGGAGGVVSTGASGGGELPDAPFSSFEEDPFSSPAGCC